MPIRHHTVCGDEVRLVVLPEFNDAARKAWAAFVDSDEVFGLDVESSAIPAFEGARKMFSPALARQTYVVPSDVPLTYRKRGYEPGSKREITVRTIQFGSPTEAWVLGVDGPWKPLVEAFLRDPAKRFVSHNAAFDVPRVKFAFGVALGSRSIDTLPMAGLIWPGQTAPTRGRSKGLKELFEWVCADDVLLRAENALHARFADLYYTRDGAKLPKSFVPGSSPCRNCRDEPSWTRSRRGFGRACYTACVGYSQTVEEWGWDNIAIDDPVFTSYAGLDAVCVRRLLPRLAEMLKGLKMAGLSQTEQRVKRIMVGSTGRGKKIDLDWTHSVKAEVEVDVNAARERLIAATGIEVKKEPRTPAMRAWLAERGVQAKKLDKDVLPLLIDRFAEDEVVGPVLADIGVFSANSNLLVNLNSIIRHAEGGEGFTHSQVNTIQAHTGRMSIQGTAEQTLAKSGIKGERLRGCYIARPGYVFVGADWDNQEIRIGAALSGDEALNRIVSTPGLSQHIVTAESVFAAEFVSKAETPKVYTRAKNLNFAQQYGAMPKKIALMSGMSITEAHRAWEAWRRTYAGMVDWSDDLAKRSHIRNPFGRVIPADPYGRGYANGNYMIQSTGRDLLGKALCNLADAGWGRYVWLPIHDEIVLEVPEEKAEAAALALGEAMTMHLPNNGGLVRVDVEIPATGEIIGERWRGLA